MIVTDTPGIQYAYRRNLNATDALAFIAEVEALDPNTAVGYLSGNLQATRGVWLRIGRYRIASGSFIDPSDLMLYVASYYEPDDAGTVEAIELNHGNAPEGVLHAATLDELLDALAQLDLGEEPDASEGEDGRPDGDSQNNPDDAADGERASEEPDAAGIRRETQDVPTCDADAPTRVADAPAPSAPSRLDGLTALEPAAAHEMHGALVRGWHAMYYEAPDGSSLLVFD